MLLIFWLVCSLNNNIHSYKIIYLRQGGEKAEKVERKEKGGGKGKHWGKGEGEKKIELIATFKRKNIEVKESLDGNYFLSIKGKLQEGKGKEKGKREVTKVDLAATIKTIREKRRERKRKWWNGGKESIKLSWFLLLKHKGKKEGKEKERANSEKEEKKA